MTSLFLCLCSLLCTPTARNHEFRLLNQLLREKIGGLYKTTDTRSSVQRENPYYQLNAYDNDQRIMFSVVCAHLCAPLTNTALNALFNIHTILAVLLPTKQAGGPAYDQLSINQKL